MTAIQRVTNYDKSLNTDLIKHPIDRENGKQLLRHIARFEASLAVAADTTFDKVMRDGGQLVRFRCMVGGALPAADETMVFDLLVNGVSVLDAGVTITVTGDGSAGDEFVEGVITGGTAAVVRGDLVRIDMAYTAGGAATPMTNCYAEVDIEYN